MIRPDDVFSIKELGLLFSRDPAAVSRTAARGRLGLPYIVGRRRFYSVAAAESFYRKQTTQADRDAARNAPPSMTGPVARRRAEAKSARARNIPLADAVKLASMALTLRDCLWVEALHAQGITDFEPPEAAQ